ncbi:MAG: hypothetical protein QOJ96_3820, partial [Alphaproteobacteria bacterium]|nr:hypothetical protein [Alphaproteobacteria bacterium]
MSNSIRARAAKLLANVAIGALVVTLTPAVNGW